MDREALYYVNDLGLKKFYRRNWGSLLIASKHEQRIEKYSLIGSSIRPVSTTSKAFLKVQSEGFQFEYYLYLVFFLKNGYDIVIHHSCLRVFNSGKITRRQD